MARPFVSVLIDTFNHERYIDQAVLSVLEQEFPASDREIVIVDDGSTDRTPEVLRSFESSARILRKSNGGQASAFNFAIPECRGECIAFLDGDDWWAPDKLRVIADAMTADSTIGMLGHSFDMVSDSTSPRPITAAQRLRLSLDDFNSANIFRLHRCFLGTSRLVLRGAIARKCLPIPESLVFEADEYLFTVAAGLAGGVILPDILTHYRVHGSNLFVAPSSSLGGERRKQQVLSTLAVELRSVLPAIGVSSAAAEAVVEIVDLEAAQLRLKLDGGWSWETFTIETALYRIQHAQASWSSRAFRRLSMIPALMLPPRSFYALRQWLSLNSWYVHVRQNVIPVPQISQPKLLPHVPGSLPDHNNRT